MPATMALGSKEQQTDSSQALLGFMMCVIEFTPETSLAIEFRQVVTGEHECTATKAGTEGLCGTGGARLYLAVHGPGGGDVWYQLH